MSLQGQWGIQHQWPSGSRHRWLGLNYSMTWSWEHRNSNLYHPSPSTCSLHRAKVGNVTASHILHMTAKRLGTTLCLHHGVANDMTGQRFFSQPLRREVASCPAREPLRNQEVGSSVWQSSHCAACPAGPPCQVHSIQQKESHAPHNWQQVSNAHWNTASWHEY